MTKRASGQDGGGNEMERCHENQLVATGLEAGAQFSVATVSCQARVALSAHPSAMRPSSSHQLAGLILW